MKTSIKNSFVIIYSTVRLEIQLNAAHIEFSRVNLNCICSRFRFQFRTYVRKHYFDSNSRKYRLCRSSECRTKSKRSSETCNRTDTVPRKIYVNKS